MSVEPRNGSLAGGTVLTIKGKAFSFVEENVKVTVGGKCLSNTFLYFLDWTCGFRIHTALERK